MEANEPARSNRKATAASERSFGIVFAVVFLIIGLYPMMKGEMVQWWAVAVAAAFGAAAVFMPRLLIPLNRLWFRLGLLLHCIVNPIIMGLVYYSTVVPTGILMRARGKDLLRLKREPDALTYWIPCEPSDPPPGSMTKQF